MSKRLKLRLGVIFAGFISCLANIAGAVFIISALCFLLALFAMVFMGDIASKFWEKLTQNIPTSK